MTTTMPRDVVGQTLVNFSRDGRFPEEDEISQMRVGNNHLPAALSALVAAKSELEAEVRSISSESAPQVDTWIKHAEALQEDIDRSRILASEVVRQADAIDVLQRAAKEAEERVEFLTKEIIYNRQVVGNLEIIKNLKSLLDQAEEAGVKNDIIGALHKLSDAWEIIDKTPTYQRTRAIQLLDERANTLQTSLHEAFDGVWDSIFNIDKDNGVVTIDKDIEDFNGAVVIMEAYKERDDRIKRICQAFNEAIIRPRIDLTVGSLASIVVQGNTIRTSSGHADRSIKSLFIDLEKIIVFLSDHLPKEFAYSLSKVMMPRLCSTIRSTWLDTAVPVALDEMTNFRKAIALVQLFSDKIKTLGWIGADELEDWVSHSPKIWLTKRRETSLDWTRNNLAFGVGAPKEVEHVETQIISRAEGKQIMSNGGGVTNGNDWDAAWSDEEAETTQIEPASPPSVQETPKDDSQSVAAEDLHGDTGANGGQDDDGEDAWGWGDEDPIDADVKAPAHEEPGTPIREKASTAVREVTLTEKYYISSMPKPVLMTIKSIIEDGVILTGQENEDNPVAAAAVGLFGLPTLILAAYRAVSPYYYTLNPGGNMFLYNDAMWLADQLRTLSNEWANRQDLSTKAHGKVKLDAEILLVEKFGRRAYGNEMNTQRTILNDLLGGAQSFLQQDGQSASDEEAAIDTVVARIREVSSEWKQILSKSAWAQATGSLLSTVARKIITDVMELSAMGADEAYRVANLIARVVKLDDLFLPDNPDPDQIPVTSQYAPNWLKLNYLSEVLQSDLKDMRYLWFESELSLYFTAQEVVELIELSFENNYRTREVIAKIRETPHPLATGSDSS